MACYSVVSKLKTNQIWGVALSTTDKVEAHAFLKLIKDLDKQGGYSCDYRIVKSKSCLINCVDDAVASLYRSELA